MGQEPERPHSIYDPESAAEAELRFLSPAPEVADWDRLGRRLDRDSLLDISVWVRAEAEQPAALARAAAAFGALDEALRHAPAGLRQRLILLEVSQMSWQGGARLSPERLALYLSDRLSGTGDEAQALMQAAWAVRRLTHPVPAPPQAGAKASADDLANFLERHIAPGAEKSLGDHPTGQEFRVLAEEWTTLISEAPALHPITRAALAWHSWRLLGLSGSSAGLESAVLAARIGAMDGRGAAGFLPLALGGTLIWQAGGTMADRLVAWLKGAEQAALRGLMEVDRLRAWRDRAEAAIADMSGRTAPRLLDALAAWPLASAPMLERDTGASRAAVQRNMARLEALRLAHEITGQTRFRFWMASL